MVFKITVLYGDCKRSTFEWSASSKKEMENKVNQFIPESFVYDSITIEEKKR